MDTIREDQLAYVAELFVAAFWAARGITATSPNGDHRQNAMLAAAVVSLTDESGSDLHDLQEIASATLIGQEFKAETVALFLDDLVHDAAQIAREQRVVAP